MSGKRVALMDPIGIVSQYLYKNRASGASISTDGLAPTNGFMVGLIRGIEFDWDSPNHASRINAFVAEYWHRAASTTVNAYFGIWYDNRSWKVYVDISEEITDLDEALKAARDRGELAIYDTVLKREIRV